MKKKITIKEPWTFHTIARTIDFKSGTHSVDDEVYEKAVADGVIKEKANGDGGSKTGEKEGSGASESA